MLVKSLTDFCLRQGFERTYWLAFSGGLDSHVLLHLLVKLRETYPIKLQAVHINHNLSVNAASWVTHCQRICDELKVPLTLREVTVTPKNIEENARNARYAVLTEFLEAKDLLFTAHHQDDQAETVLLQLIRGSGLKGLAAMPILKKLTNGFHARPLLNFTRDTLKQYAIHQQLNWIDDDSNENRQFARNFMRHEILPQLKKRWPAVSSNLSRVATHCAEAQVLLDEFLIHELAKVRGSVATTLSSTALLKLSSASLRQIIRAWLQELQLPNPPLSKFKQIEHDLLKARNDKTPLVTWNDVELRRYRDDIYALKKTVLDTSLKFEWNLEEPLFIPGLGTLKASLGPGGLKKEIKRVSVSLRHGGECIQLPGRAFHHSLKKLFQEKGIPPWERLNYPLLYVNSQLAAVVNLAISADFAALDEEGWVIN